MLVFEHLDVEDGGPTAGRGSRFTTEEYQVRGFLAPDIPNHCRQLKSFSKSSTGREALRSGWSAVRNRSSSLVGAKVFELRFRIEPVVNATERYVDRDGPRPVVVQSSRNGKAFKNTPADEFLTEMGHVEIPGFHADGDGTIDGRHRRLAVSAWMIPESDVPKLRQRHVVRDETNVRRHPRLTVDFGPHVLFDLVVYLLAIGHVDDRFGFSTPLADDVHGFFVLRFAHLRVLLPSVWRMKPFSLSWDGPSHAAVSMPSSRLSSSACRMHAICHSDGLP